jgi:hypothetical protein
VQCLHLYRPDTGLFENAGQRYLPLQIAQAEKVCYRLRIDILDGNEEIPVKSGQNIVVQLLGLLSRAISYCRRSMHFMDI